MLWRSPAALVVIALTLLATLTVLSAQAPTPVACWGNEPTIVGTPGDDLIGGTPERDIIHAGAGDDVVKGFGGDDVICGGAGHDIVHGGSGNDRITTGSGRDQVRGGLGDDEIEGGSGDDHLHGNAGDDTLSGRDGDDELRAGAGDDQVWAHAGADRVAGHAGSDELRGGPGGDLVTGGAGQDRLSGGAGRDGVRGGAGRDRLEGGPGGDHLHGGAGPDEITAGPGDDAIVGGGGVDYVDGGRGTDRCSDPDGADAAICEGSAPPAGTFECLPDGHDDVYVEGFIGWAADAASGPRGPAVVIGDSLTSGDPTDVVRRLRRSGYGPVCVDAVGTRGIHGAAYGYPGGLIAIARVRTAHPIWSSDATWIVALGTNDTRFWPELDAETARYQVALVTTVIGPAARDLWWMNVRSVEARWQAAEDAWNAGMAQNAGLGVIDWSTLAAGRQDWFYDEVHPNKVGRRHWVGLIATTLTAGD